MARNAYSGDKRRREIAKKKKREGKLDRKQVKDEVPAEEDKSYLEYLHPGGVPEELLPKSDSEDTDDAAGEDDSDDNSSE